MYRRTLTLQKKNDFFGRCGVKGPGLFFRNDVLPLFSPRVCDGETISHRIYIADEHIISYVTYHMRLTV